MSSNDVIHLIKTEKGYEVVHKDIEIDQPYKRMKAKTLREAVSQAQVMHDIYQPEYGVWLDVIRTEDI